LKLQLNRNC